MTRHILDASEHCNYVRKLVKAISAYNDDHPPECVQCKGVGYVCSGCPRQVFDECPLGNEMVFPK